MTIDLSKAKKGDTVHFRCGGKAVVREIKDNENELVDIVTDLGEEAWYKDGSYFISGPTYLDITRIEPAPFDWKDVKPGVKFESCISHVTNFYSSKIDELQDARRENNKNWIDLMRLAFELDPVRAKEIMRNIVNKDAEIMSVARDLAE